MFNLIRLISCIIFLFSVASFTSNIRHFRQNTRFSIGVKLFSTFNENNRNLIKTCKSKFATVTIAVVAACCSPMTSFADDDAKATQKLFEACYSQCMFEETRPPPVGASIDRILETKPRTEILKTCRTKCAKNKKQLLLGKPKEVPTPQQKVLQSTTES